MPAPHTRIAALLGYVLAVVATPRGVLWPHAVHAAVLASCIALVRLRRRAVLTGLALELPFIVFALLIPFVALGPRVQLGPVQVSEPGLAAAASMLAKATLSVLAATTFASVTSQHELVDGLDRLRLPRGLVQVLSFMVRYGAVVADDVQRMRIALVARGFRATSLRQWPVLGTSVGALFIRTYERGERVHLAMLSRGYTGTMPPTSAPDPAHSRWGRVLLALAAAWSATAIAIARARMGS